MKLRRRTEIFTNHQPHLGGCAAKSIHTLASQPQAVTVVAGHAHPVKVGATKLLVTNRIGELKIDLSLQLPLKSRPNRAVHV